MRKQKVIVLLNVTNATQNFRLKSHTDYLNPESKFFSTFIPPFNKMMCVPEGDAKHCSPRFAFLKMINKVH